MKYDLDTGMGTRIGLVVLSTDETLETEARHVLAGRDVGVHHTRIFSDNEVSPENLLSMQERMAASAALLPGGLDAVGYGCTSASALMGPDLVEGQVQLDHPGVPVTNPISAVVAGLRALNASRIAMVTPYSAQVVAPMRTFLESRGIEVVHNLSFGETDDRRVARITEASTHAAVTEAARAKGVQAIFTSCTNLRTFGVIDALESQLGLPVVSSNQALIWHVLGRAGTEARGWGPGRLFQTEGVRTAIA
ncbi:aspartate/glutamate racemase family protein [Roseovarius atlanticus]|uniref:maleate cis-trans isomerase family protein n=1 Tax=Roseovarius atlanticus TaxID=1641875 RepID=UPI001C986D4A|nr:aspartate/glutamate racemase family protein [Roseovarius atlanticus]MBY5988936.1 aspartate/glutamate racemase family protein [Roseovarius atlanticus]MBY6124328.1 aspartate/glutamate racemase family protein [Roseovarius atlanticus]MBY6148823.1 aspartate/glutamate racemase family protein [Roseovarius atlanticus]